MTLRFCESPLGPAIISIGLVAHTWLPPHTHSAILPGPSQWHIIVQPPPVAIQTSAATVTSTLTGPQWVLVSDVFRISGPGR